MMVLDHRYSMDDEDALARARALTDYWSRRYGVRCDWRGSEVEISGRVMGVKFEGNVRLGGGSIHAEMNAGFLAERLGARGYVERKLGDYFNPLQSLAELQARVPA